MGEERELDGQCAHFFNEFPCVVDDKFIMVCVWCNETFTASKTPKPKWLPATEENLVMGEKPKWCYVKTKYPNGREVFQGIMKYVRHYKANREEVPCVSFSRDGQNYNEYRFVESECYFQPAPAPPELEEG